MARKIFRIIIGDSRRRKVGLKLVEGVSAKSILQRPKSSFVGHGRTIIGVMPTKLRGTLKSREKLPRSKRFGRGFR